MQNNIINQIIGLLKEISDICSKLIPNNLDDNNNIKAGKKVIDAAILIKDDADSIISSLKTEPTQELITDCQKILATYDTFCKTHKLSSSDQTQNNSFTKGIKKFFSGFETDSTNEYYMLSKFTKSIDSKIDELDKLLKTLEEAKKNSKKQTLIKSKSLTKLHLNLSMTNFPLSYCSIITSHNKETDINYAEKIKGKIRGYTLKDNQNKITQIAISLLNQNAHCEKNTNLIQQTSLSNEIPHWLSELYDKSTDISKDKDLITKYLEDKCLNTPANNELLENVCLPNLKNQYKDIFLKEILLPYLQSLSQDQLIEYYASPTEYAGPRSLTGTFAELIANLLKPVQLNEVDPSRKENAEKPICKINNIELSLSETNEILKFNFLLDTYWQCNYLQMSYAKIQGKTEIPATARYSNTPRKESEITPRSPILNREPLRLYKNTEIDESMIEEEKNNYLTLGNLFVQTSHEKISKLLHLFEDENTFNLLGSIKNCLNGLIKQFDHMKNTPRKKSPGSNLTPRLSK